MTLSWRAVRTRLLVGAATRWRRVGMRRHHDAVDAVLAAARSTMRAKKFCLLVTDDADGTSSARVVDPFRPDPDMVVHIGTSRGSRKAAQIATTGRVLLVYQQDSAGACVVARCTAGEVDDAAVRERHFKPLWRAYWPDGPADGDFTVFRCVPDTLEVWDALRGITPPPFGLRAAVLSRHDSGTWRLDP